MKLQKTHRQALLSEFEKAKADLDTCRRCLLEDERTAIQQHFEIAIFLAQERIKLIKQSLIDNEIDF
jgi:hypothetical protein